MENKELYPKGTVNQTEEFALRQKIKKIVGENVEEIIKDETIKAFEKNGYKEKDGYMYVVAAGGKDNNEKEVGKGVKEGKINVTVSIPKLLNMGATKPVSYMQKVTTFGGKKIISEIYLEILDTNVHIDYKNTEAAAFHQSSEKDSYAPKKLNKSGNITGIEKEGKFKSDFKEFFKSIAEAEAEYLIDTKIGNDDKTQKDMNDSIVKENKHSMKLTDLLSSSFEEAGSKINKLVKESLDKKEDSEKSEVDPKKDKLLVGGEKSEDDSLEEISMSPGAPVGVTGGATEAKPNSVGGAYPAKSCFKQGDAEQSNSDKNLGYTLAESVKNTTYGTMRTTRPHLQRQEDGSYKLMTESSRTLKTPYTVEVKMEPGELNVPANMNNNYTMGMHEKGAVNSKEELKNTGHGELSQLEKEEKIEEAYQRKLDLTKRRFSSLSENEEKGINKRYVITEKLTSEEQSKRWKKLYENDCFCDIKDQKDSISRDEFEVDANKEFKNNNPLESNLCNTPFSGEEEEGFVDVPKARGSMIMFRLSESDVKQNKMYLVDHYTKKLVLNPLYKSRD